MRFELQDLKDFAKQIYKLPIYPVLFTLYPILFLYANNLDEVTIGVLWLPALLGVFTSSSLLMIGWLVYKSWYKSAALVLVGSLIFFNYGRIVPYFPDIDIQNSSIPIGTDAIALAVFGLIAILAAFMLWRIESSKINKLVGALNFISFSLIIFSIVQMIPTEFSRLSMNQDEIANVSAVTSNVSVNKFPDVYYLVFDRYAGNKTLADLYHFDNSKFHDYLRGKGFYVAEDSTANYAKTSFSLASTLNMKYHEPFDRSLGNSYPSEVTDIYPLLKSHIVGEEFKRHGYKFIQLGSWYWQTVQAGGVADQNYSLAKQQSVMGVDPFMSRLITTTAMLPIIEKLNPEMLQIDNYRSHYLSTEFQREKIKEIISDKGQSKFVFMHMLSPHSPYVYDERCQYIAEAVVADDQRIQRYTDMVSCTNVIIKQIVEDILVQSQIDPVIIIQADEGAYPIYDWGNDPNPYESEEVGRLHERYRIQNAYYFPDRDYAQLYQEITPVNSFRVLINNLFGSNLELLPDKNYQFKDNDLKFDFIDVSDKVLGK